MRIARWMTALLVAAVPAACDSGEQPREQPAAAPAVEEGQGVEAEDLANWNVRLDDEGMDESGFQMVASDDGFEVTTGPAGIAWRPVDLVEQGDFTVSATFREIESPEGHREGYGLLVGGKHLDSPDLEYTYFLLRGTGEYLVKRREGTSTSEITSWKPMPDTTAAGAGGQAGSRLAVQVRGDSVRFVVNGSTVETLPTEAVEPWGLAGVRVNHRLDVEVSDFEVARAGSRAPS